MSCVVCRAEKVIKTCALCKGAVCKDCVQYLSRQRFLFLPKPPNFMNHAQYCVTCFDSKIAPELAAYDAVVEEAKEVTVIVSTYRGQIPVIQKSPRVVEVRDHADKDEAILHLAYLARLGGWNSIIEVKLEPKKVRNHAFESTSWSGTALPAKINVERFDRRNS